MQALRVLLTGALAYWAVVDGDWRPAVRECCKHAVANGAVEPSVLAFLYEGSDDRHLPAELRPEGSGLRYRARPRHVQHARRGARPVPVRRDEVEALLGVCRSWRDRFL